MKANAKNARSAASKFLKAYKALDYDAMYEASTLTWKNRNGLEKLKQIFQQPISGYKIQGVKKVTEVVYDVNILLQAADGEINALIRTVAETDPFKPSVKGELKANPISIRKIK